MTTLQGIMATEIGEEGAPSVESATELQIQIARMFRQVRALCCVCLKTFDLASD